MGTIDKQEQLQVLRSYGFSRIAVSIELMWNSPELGQYFLELVVPDRQDRNGFPAEVLSAIIKLSNIHDGIKELRIVKR